MFYPVADDSKSLTESVVERLSLGMQPATNQLTQHAISRLVALGGFENVSHVLERGTLVTPALDNPSLQSVT